jgi:GT2 family glycosyltransferase
MEKDKDRPGILVVIATLGQRTKLLEQTLKSVADQDLKVMDIVLVYPLNDTKTAKLAKKYHARSIKDPGSMTSAVNAGIRVAQKKHKYVTWIGDDDLLAQDSLKSSIDALESDPKAVASYGYCDYIDDQGNYILTSKAGSIAPWLMKWGPNLVPLPGSVYKVSALQSLDYMFDESLKYAMDLDLFLRLQKIGKLVNVRKKVSSFRWHSTSTTVANRHASLDEAERIKHKHLPKPYKYMAFLWERPIRLATLVATRRVSKLIEKRVL